MRPITLKVPAGSFTEEALDGDYVRLKSASAEITIETDQNEKAAFQEGDDAQFSPFKRLRFTHSEGADQTIIVYVGKGTRQGSSRVGGTLVIKPTQSATGSQAVVTVTGSSAQVLAANSNRKYLLIQNRDAVGNIYLNIFGAAAEVGPGGASIMLAPGEKLEMSGVWLTTAEIRAIGDIPSNANVLVVEGE